MTYVQSVKPMTPKPDGFRVLDIEHPHGLNNSSQKELRSQTSHFITTHIFWREHSCLMRQEVQLLNEAFFFFFLHYARVIHLTSLLIFIRDTKNKYTRY